MNIKYNEYLLNNEYLIWFLLARPKTVLDMSFGFLLITLRPGKKNFGSGQLIFENWSGGPVDLFSFFLNHNINIPNLIVQKVLKHEIQIKPVLNSDD